MCVIVIKQQKTDKKKKEFIISFDFMPNLSLLIWSKKFQATKCCF